MANLYLSVNPQDHQLATVVYFEIGGGELVFKMLWEALEPMIDRGYAYLDWLDAYCKQFKEPLKSLLKQDAKAEILNVAEINDITPMFASNKLIIGELANMNVCLYFDKDLVASSKQYIISKLLNHCNCGVIYLDF